MQGRIKCLLPVSQTDQGQIPEENHSPVSDEVFNGTVLCWYLPVLCSWRAYCKAPLLSLRYIPQISTVCKWVCTAKWQKGMRVQMLDKEEEWAGRQEWNCSRCLAEPFYVRCWGKLMYSSRKCQYCIWQYCREEWFMEVPGVWSKHGASEEQHCYRWTSRASCILVSLSESWMLYSLSFGNPTYSCEILRWKQRTNTYKLFCGVSSEWKLGVLPPIIIIIVLCQLVKVSKKLSFASFLQNRTLLQTLNKQPSLGTGACGTMLSNMYLLWTVHKTVWTKSEYLKTCLHMLK